MLAGYCTIWRAFRGQPDRTVNLLLRRRRRRHREEEAEAAGCEPGALPAAGRWLMVSCCGVPEHRGVLSSARRDAHPFLFLHEGRVGGPHACSVWPAPSDRALVRARRVLPHASKRPVRPCVSAERTLVQLRLNLSVGHAIRSRIDSSRPRESPRGVGVSAPPLREPMYPGSLNLSHAASRRR